MKIIKFKTNEAAVKTAAFFCQFWSLALLKFVLDMTYLFGKKNRSLYTLLLAFISCTGCGKYYMEKRPNKLWKQISENSQHFDVAIVPGFPFNGQTWDPLMKARISWSVYLFKKGIVRNFIFSGAAVHTPYVEAEYMKRYAIAAGIPEDHIFIETQAQHSTENIFYGYELARNLGFRSIALVTDPLQSWLTGSFTRRRFCTPVQHIPFLIDTLRANELDIDWIPQAY
jgi:vancomycin permeability regulator SanA